MKIFNEDWLGWERELRTRETGMSDGQNKHFDE